MNKNKQNEFLNLIIVGNMFSTQECDTLIKILDDKWVSGKTIGSKITGKTDDIRVVEIAMKELPKLVTSKILEKVFDANKKFYNFNIKGFEDYDPPLMFRYTDAEKSHYDWHNDFGPTNISTRKLSFSILLSDPNEFEGGTLEFIPSFSEYTSVRKGSIVIFPSYLIHRVTEVTKGIRYCIVGWIHGDSFQ